MKRTRIIYISVAIFILISPVTANLIEKDDDASTHIKFETKLLKKVLQRIDTKEWLQASKVTVAVTPDGSYSLIKNILPKANSYIYIEIYQFWSDEIFNLINETLQANPSLIVKVLIENDTGQRGVKNNPDKFNIHYAYKFYQLKVAGYNVEVRFETSQDYYHGKLIIVDGKYVLVSSENFIPTSFPEDPENIRRPQYNGYYYYSKPSRGWVALIEDNELAKYFEEIFNSDFNNGRPYDPDIDGTGAAFDSYSPVSYSPLTPAYTTVSNVLIKPVVSPIDSWGNITDLLMRANHTILIEQMYIRETAWGLVDILDDLHRNKKVTVYIILEDDYPGNYGDIVDNLTDLGFHVVAAFNQDEDLFLHNKGIIVDDEIVFVGSINWSGGSFEDNREFGVIIKSREIASFLRNIYGFDWDNSKPNGEYPFDTDGDGLPDYYEIEHGLDRTKIDTDGDGYTDYEEVYIRKTDPKKPNVVETSTFVVYKPINESLTNSAHINVSVYVNSTKVASLDIYLNDVKDRTISVTGIGWYNFTIGALDYGLNTIKIISRDGSDNKLNEVTLHIYLDNRPPNISVSGIVNNSMYKIGDVIEFSWTVSDEYPYSTKVFLDGELSSIEINGTLILNTKDPKLYTGRHELIVEAVDKAGNVGRKIIYFYVDKPQIISLNISPKNGSTIYQEEINLRINIEIKIVNITSVSATTDSIKEKLNLEGREGERWIWSGEIKVGVSPIKLEIETTHHTFHFTIVYKIEENPLLRLLYQYRYEIALLIIMLILFLISYYARRR